MNEDRLNTIHKVNEFLNVCNNDIWSESIGKMNEYEKEMLALILDNVTFTRSGIQPYSFQLYSFCKIFKIDTVMATDTEIMKSVNELMLKFSRYEVCEDSEYGKTMFCGYKINWVTGVIIVSPNPALEKMQKKWRQFNN